jgi:hypothetical protein
MNITGDAIALLLNSQAAGALMHIIVAQATVAG